MSSSSSSWMIFVNSIELPGEASAKWKNPPELSLTPLVVPPSVLEVVEEVEAMVKARGDGGLGRFVRLPLIMIMCVCSLEQPITSS